MTRESAEALADILKEWIQALIRDELEASRDEPFRDYSYQRLRTDVVKALEALP